jgi:two-component system phosphate regulon response regulator PhoB
MNHLANILIIEDDQDIRDLMYFQLKNEGHTVEQASNGSIATDILATKDFDLVIVDWMLPGKNGIDICKSIRQKETGKNIAVLMVTALNQPENIIEGLDAGADDYITKPFDLSVFQARIRAQLRRLEIQEAQDSIEVDNLKVEFNKCRVFYNNDEIQLTSTEFKILSLLAKSPGHVYTRENLINNIQGESIHVTNRTIDTHIAGLRKKIKDASHLIETIRGVGYRFKE